MKNRHRIMAAAAILSLVCMLVPVQALAASGCTNPSHTSGDGLDHSRADCGVHNTCDSGFVASEHQLAACGVHKKCDSGFVASEHQRAACGIHKICDSGFVASEHQRAACGNMGHNTCDSDFVANEHQRAACGNMGHNTCDSGFVASEHQLAACGNKGHNACASGFVASEHQLAACGTTGHNTCASGFVASEHQKAPCGTESHFKCGGCDGAAPVVHSDNVEILGNSATLQVTATDNTVPLFQWHLMNDSGVWENIQNATTEEYLLNGLVDGKTYTVRCMVYDASYHETFSTVRMFTIHEVKKATAVTLSDTRLTITVGKSQQLTATVKPDNATDKSVVWESSNTAVATVDANGKVTAMGTGTATVTATAKDGSGQYATCTVAVKQPVTSITMSKTGYTLTAPKMTIQLTATASPANADIRTVTWASSNNEVARVAQDGTVTAVTKGTATIKATAEDGSGAFATCAITVEQPVTDIQFVTGYYTLTAKGKTANLSRQITVSPSNANSQAVKWTTSNKKVVTVNSKGVVKAVAAKGSAVITATAMDGSGKKATIKVVVGKRITAVKLNATAKTMAKGKTYALKATVSPSGTAIKSVKWSSSNTSVATVDSRGRVTAKAKGTAKITALANDGSGKKAMCKIVVK